MLKFTVIESPDIKHRGHVFEAGNTYDAAKYGLTESDIRGLFNAGFVSVEGWGAAPERKPGVQNVSWSK